MLIPENVIFPSLNQNVAPLENLIGKHLAVNTWFLKFMNNGI